MKAVKAAALVAAFVVTLAFTGCASTRVSRVDAGTQIDLTGKWNDTDVRLVCETLIDQCLGSRALTNAVTAKKGKTPTVIVGTIRNDSSEHMDTTIISTMMRNAIINDGRLSFVASGDARNEIRAERQDQQVNASERTAKELANETAADFMLTGSVKSMVEQSGGQSVRSYFVTAELTNTETNTLIWAGENNDVKKVVRQSKAKL